MHHNCSHQVAKFHQKQLGLFLLSAIITVVALDVQESDTFFQCNLTYLFFIIYTIICSILQSCIKDTIIQLLQHDFESFNILMTLNKAFCLDFKKVK